MIFPCRASKVQKRLEDCEGNLPKCRRRLPTDFPTLGHWFRLSGPAHGPPDSRPTPFYSLREPSSANRRRRHRLSARSSQAPDLASFLGVIHEDVKATFKLDPQPERCVCPGRNIPPGYSVRPTLPTNPTLSSPSHRSPHLCCAHSLRG